MGSIVRVEDAAAPAELDDVRRLIRAFVAWHRERHVEDLHLIDAYFDAAAFEEELRGLPGKYAPPDGRLLLATLDNQAAGCVALKPLDGEVCEMKRMFVYPQFQGRGIGLELGRRILGHAKSRGYRAMRLDTSVRQVEARRLYERLGFRVIDPYYETPSDVRDWLVFMELTL
jgi:ribosomal protein S18 acetylase RimI-like enzyme